MEADFGSRLLASFIDAALMLIPGAMILIFGLPAALDADDYAIPFTLAVILAAVMVLFLPAVLDALTEGSIGRRLARIRVVNGRARRPGLLQSMLRHVLKYVGHFAAPVVLRLIESIVFSGRTLHDVVTQTHVVNRRADEADIRQAVATGPRSRWPGIALWTLSGLVLLLAGSILVSAISQRQDGASPTRNAVDHLARIARSYTLLTQNHYMRTGAFPSDLEALRSGKLPPEIRAIQIEPGSGRLIVVAATAPIEGLRIVLAPEFKRKRDRVTIRRWHCGSTDIPRADLPSTCDDPVEAIAAR